MARIIRFFFKRGNLKHLQGYKKRQKITHHTACKGDSILERLMPLFEGNRIPVLVEDRFLAEKELVLK